MRRHCAGEVGKFTTTSRQILGGCCVPKIIQIAQFSTELFPKQKGGRFFETQCIYTFTEEGSNFCAACFIKFILMTSSVGHTIHHKEVIRINIAMHAWLILTFYREGMLFVVVVVVVVVVVAALVAVIVTCILDDAYGE